MKQLIVHFFTFLIITSLQAQSNYTFEADMIPYQDLTGSTSLNNGAVWDDPAYTIPIGFNFQIGTFTLNTLYIPDWALGGTVASSPVDVGAQPVLTLISQDLISLAIGSSSPISYKLEGTSGNQILIIEWKNFGFFDDSTGNDFMNMQLWLHEGTNVIEYRFGPASINNPNETFEGLTGFQVAFNASFNFNTAELEDIAFLLSGNPANPTPVLYQAGDIMNPDLALNGSIPEGTVYRFVPESLGVDDFNNTSITVFPNPAKQNLHILTTSTNFDVEIYNTLGKQVAEFSHVKDRIDVSGLPTGLYFVKIKSNNNTVTVKFIKE